MLAHQLGYGNGGSVRPARPRVDRHEKSTHRPADVLKRLLPYVPRLKRDLADGVLIDAAGDADAAGLCQRLKPCRDVDAVAEKVAAPHRPDERRSATSIRRPDEASALRWLRHSWMSMAALSACTALGNSASIPSPISLNTRPLCSARIGHSRGRGYAYPRQAVQQLAAAAFLSVKTRRPSKHLCEASRYAVALAGCDPQYERSRREFTTAHFRASS
jgi:hypothetical protein